MSLIASQEKSYTETSRFEDQSRILQQQEQSYKVTLQDDINQFI